MLPPEPGATLRPVLARLATGAALSEEEAEAAFGAILDGDATPEQTAALAMALRVRGETLPELVGAVRALRARMLGIPAPPDAIDVCGTGGDGAATLNVSTAVAFVLAGAGLTVAKHGNRAASSAAGGADVLAALDIPLAPPLETLPALLETTRLAFLFAPRHHPGLARVAPTRRALGLRTIFNLLGPLANPAGVRTQLVGVYDPAWLPLLADTLGSLGTTRAWIVHGNGLDELSLAGTNQVVAWEDGRRRHFTLTAADAGLASAPASAIAGGDAAHNAAALLGLLQGTPGAYRDTVLLNAAAALVLAGRAPSLREGVRLAAEAIDGGAALGVLRAHQAIV
jgi:anthranilate phosphoribosyltransferase